MTMTPEHHIRPRYDGRQWDELVVNTPLVCAASATTVRQLLVPPSAKALVVGLSATANITSVTVAGTGSGITYLTVGAAPATAFYAVQVMPQLDDHLTITVVTNSSGPCVVYLDTLDDAAGLTTILGAIVGTAVTVVGYAPVDASSTVTAGGTAQAVFGGAPTNGYEIINPSASEDLWIADNGSTAAVGASGSIRVPLNGGVYFTKDTMKPFAHDVSLYGATTGHAFTARRW